ncbi:MAG: hypothetical protein JO266_10265 [Acidobacteria bacterium]|nr:hypothetical protein [Pseudonocardiales bacterium]MBV8892335.1 hypothetical protein [Acidobacteriota bacterium]MBV9031714.1 hypothetical protein [Pseudonocardiales bacterium]
MRRGHEEEASGDDHSGAGRSALLRELITIPDRIHQGDFVLRLTAGVRGCVA